MPLRLDIRRELTARSERVKSVDLHPTEPWLLCSLYSGQVHIWNTTSSTLIKNFEVCDLPVRAAKFVPRKNWVVSGSDDMHVRVFNYNTLERQHAFEAHSDYIRCIAVHPSQPFILTSSDDMLIKLWDWEKKWQCQQVFEGHTHYVMQVVFNRKDANTFCSASLDRTLKVWQLGSNQPNFTLEGHEKGVNCVDYYSGGDKPYLISGADDRLVKIWDYQNKTCVQTLDGHSQNVTAVCYHPEKPIIMSGSEDGSLRIWHSNTYRLEDTLTYNLERVWCVQAMKGSNSVAIGYDEGTILIKMGKDEPAVTMDAKGKIIWSRNSELCHTSLQGLDFSTVRDGERIVLPVKDGSAAEIFPQTLQHNANGRFVVACGDGEYIIYTSMALRNKAFGSALEFIWSYNAAEFAVRESSQTVKIHNMNKPKDAKSFKPEFGADQIFTGPILGVRGGDSLAFYSWEDQSLVRRIEIDAKQVFWSENHDLVALCSDDSFYVLKYNAEHSQEPDEDGFPDAFEVLGEIEETVKTGVWVGDCFIFTNALNRLNYYVGGEIVTVAHLEKPLYLLGYLPDVNRVFLADAELNVISYNVELSILQYQTAVMRQDFDTANEVLPSIPKSARPRVAHFLEKQGFKKQALAVTTDPEHQFDLALQLGELDKVVEIAKEIDSVEKWRSVADLATKNCELKLASEALRKAKDHGGLLLLATSAGDSQAVTNLANDAEAEGKFNVAFLSHMLTGNLTACLNLLLAANRLPEAAMFCRTYLPSEAQRVTTMWKESLSGKHAEAIAEPEKYPNLFGEYEDSLRAEKFYNENKTREFASEYPEMTAVTERDLIEESIGMESEDEEVAGSEDIEENEEIDAEEEEIEDSNDAADSDAKVPEASESSNQASPAEIISDSEVAALEAELDCIDVNEDDVDDLDSEDLDFE